MTGTIVICTGCGAAYSPADPLWVCLACGSLLEVRADLSTAADNIRALLLEENAGSSRGVWRWARVIPVDSRHAVSMGEGDTPVVPLLRLGRELGLERLYAKLEYFSPTGSFKDRGTTVLVTKAKEIGVSRVVEDSSGNAGASFAAYCARAGIAASIYVPASAPEAKKAQVAFYGAEAVPVSGTREDVTEAAVRRCDEEGAYYGSHNLNPWFLQGTKSFAYEVAREFRLDPPEHVVMPVGNGSLLLGASMGFRELRGMGLVERFPKLHIAQAEACMPVAEAFRQGLEETAPFASRPTIAGGISIAKPSRGHLILRAVRESGGSAAAVADEEILRFQRMLARLEGIFCEPTSAAAFAVLPRLVTEGAIDPAERVLVAVTGIGLKDTSVLAF